MVTLNKNERTVIDLLTKLCHTDEHLQPIVHFKWHKKKDMLLSEVYGKAFEEKLSAIRVMNEKIPPIRWSQPFPTIDYTTLQKLKLFSQQLDVYNIKRKTAELKTLGDHMTKSLINTRSNKTKLLITLEKQHFHKEDKIKQIRDRNIQIDLGHLLYNNTLMHVEQAENKHFGEVGGIKVRTRAMAQNLSDIVSNFTQVAEKRDEGVI